MANGKKHYVVIRGVKPGIYNAWYGAGGAEEQVKGYENALFKGFTTMDGARRWLQEMTSPAKELCKAPDIHAISDSGVLQPPSPRLRKKRPISTPPRPYGDETSFPGIVVYTDGGCRRNPGPGGYGAVISDGGNRRELSGGFRLTTNNRMELTACVVALRAIEKPADVVLHSDSRYVVNGIEKGWAKKWSAHGWMRTPEEPALNADLWAMLLEECARHHVRFVWVRGHAGNRENERCDTLATEAALKRGLPEDTGYNLADARRTYVPLQIS